MLRTVPLALACLAIGLTTGSGTVLAQPTGAEVCETTTVEGAEAQVCARRAGFGVEWTAQVEDTAADGRPDRRLH